MGLNWNIKGGGKKMRFKPNLNNPDLKWCTAEHWEVIAQSVNWGGEWGLKRREQGEEMKGGGRGDQEERGGEAVEVSREDREGRWEEREVSEGDGGEKIKATSVRRWPH